MLDRLFGFKIHSFLHVLGMSILAFGLPLNKVLMSIGAIWGVSNLVLEGDLKSYLSNCKKNKPFLWLLAFFILHIIALIWSSDLNYGLHDLGIKMPLIAVPLALVARPIKDRKHIHIIFYFLLISLLITSFLNFGYYQQWFGPKQYSDIRQMSLFGSHIRYGILIALGAAILLYFLYYKNTPINKWIWITLFLWFSVYTFYSQILSGALSLIVVFLVFILYISYSYNKYIPLGIGLLLATIIYGLFVFLKPEKQLIINKATLPKMTKEGNLYKNDFSNQNREKNKPVYILICDLELEREWSKLSKIPYYGKDLRGQYVRNTLIRYLASKNLSKDAEGIVQLSKSDVSNIENGIASVELLKTGIVARLYGIKYQLNNDFDPNGHSVLQRLTYWKTGWHIIQKNWLFGVGTGNVQIAFNQQYTTENSILLPHNRLRAHNMYLTVWISFGIIGLIIFLGFLISYLKLALNNKELFPILFFAVMVITFFIEDTIETQMGVSILSLFIGLFMQKIESKSSQN
jgi:hypothetical protein